MKLQRSKHSLRQIKVFAICLMWGLMLLLARTSYGQMDQGALTGTVRDSSGALIPQATVVLTSTETGLVLKREANSGGTYVFSPVKIGEYTVSASSPGFETVLQKSVQINIQARVTVDFSLKPGAVSDVVTVSNAPPLLQSEEGSVGQVITAEAINDTPLNGRNWVYIAQLTAGVEPSLGGTRGSGTGDFIANGQSGEQNNFILDGVDNNTNLVDFLNGSSYIVRPPPDALAQFKIQTSNYSAEFGHSAGAVVNASIKSGTNTVHGSLWEYARNTIFDAPNWNSPVNAPYHENQFGATLGLPIIKNKLFYFGDAEMNRIEYSGTYTYSVPTALMRTGDFSELLNTGLTGNANPIYLYAPNSGGNTDKTGQSTLNRQSCNGKANVLCPSQIDSVALKILNLYPAPAGPNAVLGKTVNNLVENVKQSNNTWQWDQRLDWNISPRDLAYARYSYYHYSVLWDTPLGPVLDGSGYGGYRDSNLASNFMLSETHTFTPKLINEFRFGYNWGNFSYLQENAFTDISSQLGLGGVPFATIPRNGGLPGGSVSGITKWGAPANSFESQNVYQILDNVSTTLGGHSLKVGVSIQNLRFAYQYSSNSRGSYSYTGRYTSSPAASITTGYGVADFLTNQMASAAITNAPNINNQQSYYSSYVQDDWKVTPRLTLNLGARYDYYQPYKEMSGSQANLIVTSAGVGTGTAVYQVQNSQNVPLGANFTNLFTANHISIEPATDERLVSSQKVNFAPRIGFALRPDKMSVLNGGFGIFYGGLQSEGGGNLGSNFPFYESASIPTPTCAYNNCPSIGLTLESGLSAQLAGGLQSFVSAPVVRSTDLHIKTPYTMDYSLSAQRALTQSLVATIGYVGNVSRHIEEGDFPNNATQLLAAGKSTTATQPFPGLGSITQLGYHGVMTYNSLQTKLEQRFSNGLSFLMTYTWAHAMSDTSDDGGIQTSVSDRQRVLIPVIQEFTNSPFDVRHRLTFNGHYDLPFGRGRLLLHSIPKALDLALGGWSTSLTYVAQTGNPITVTPNSSVAAGGTARAILVRNPFAPGGSPDPTNPSVACAPSTRNRTNWYNPCAFANPLLGNTITTPITDTATAIAYLGGRSNLIYGPGYNRTNMSLFKSFGLWREQSLEFRADAFNLFNHPSLGNPSILTDNSNGGAITGVKAFQTNTPDARFLQLSLKYAF